MTNTYDANGNRLTYYLETLENGQVTQGEKYIYTYDANGKELTWLFQSLANGELVDINRKNSIYDANGNTTEISNEQWKDGQWIICNSQLTFYDALERAFFFTAYKIEVTYKGITSINDEIAVAGFLLNCFPNPASDYIEISTIPSETSKIYIYNILGEIVKSESIHPMTASHRMNIENLPKGTYFMTIKSGNKTETKKFEIIR
jgi:hypothetical protein